MNYPLISEYIESIKLAEDNFDELSYLRPVLDNMGHPVMSGGNFAVVFKMKDERDGKLYAVKCFTREQEGRTESYKLISDELEFVSSNYLTPIKYLENELFVDTKSSDEEEFPVLLMDWVEGVTLDKYIRANKNDMYALGMLAYRFGKIASWLLSQPFAHGDLKPDNILVREDGTIVLVDYDGMYVPAMKGQKAREIGSPDYRHPARTEKDFDEHIDDFSLVLILLSLKAISLNPHLLEEFDTDCMLFSERDFSALGGCERLSLLLRLNDVDMNRLLGLLLLAYSEGNLSNVSFKLLCIAKPQREEFIFLKAPMYARAAFPRLLKDAEQGDAVAQDHVAYLYMSGLGVEQNYNEALKWLEKAVSQGNASAQNHLGIMYHNGTGVACDLHKAGELWEMAAQQGNTNAMLNLGGNLGRKGWQKKGMARFKKEAEMGNSYAQLCLGWIYKYGKGVMMNDSLAVKWFRKAAESGNAAGQWELGVMYENGEGVERDYGKAIYWYRKAANLEHDEAWHDLAMCYLKGLGVQKDYVRALECINKAEEFGGKEMKEKCTQSRTYILAKMSDDNN